MIYLFTDFGYQGPYVGELHALFKHQLPQTAIIDLMHDAPMFNPRASSYLLGALSRRFQTGDICLAVVDPGVGSDMRRALLIETDGLVFCGPDNGLFCQVIRLAQQAKCYEINWRPDELSASFHGRDLFAPALVKYIADTELAINKIESNELRGWDWPADLMEVIYFDMFGNAITGVRASQIQHSTLLHVNNISLSYAHSFTSVEKGQAFWYENSMGLVEMAVNQGSAREKLKISIGSSVSLTEKSG